MKQAEPVSQRRIIIWVSVFTSFLTPFMAASVPIALPAIAKQFSMNAVELSWVANAYLLASAVFLVPFGRLADMRGRKRMLLWGISLFTLASLLIAFSINGASLIAFRFLQGLGGAMIFSTSVALLISVIAPSERGKILGYTIASVYLGLSLGPVIGGFATQQLGWRSIFLLPVPFSLLLLALIFVRVKGEWADAAGERFDSTGSLVYIVSLVCVMLGVTALPRLSGILLIGAGSAGLALFIFLEKRTPFPILHVELFIRNRVFAFSNLAALINYSATFAIPFLLSIYLQNVKPFTPQQAGMILLSQPLLQSLLSPYAGRLSDRIQARRVASAGMLLCMTGLFLFILITPSTSLVLIIGNLALLGAGFAFFSSPNTSAVMGSVDKKFFGIASATLATMRMSGQMFSMGVLTLLFSLGLGKSAIGPETVPLFMKTWRIAFAFFTLICFLGIFASLARGSSSIRNDPLS